MLVNRPEPSSFSGPAFGFKSGTPSGQRGMTTGSAARTTAHELSSDSRRMAQREVMRRMTHRFAQRCKALAPPRNNWRGYTSNHPHPIMKHFLLHCCAGLLWLAPLPVFAQKASPKPVEMKSPGYPSELTDTGLSGVAEVDFSVKTDG